MNETWQEIIHKWQQTNVLVIGEAMLDVFIRGTVTRVNREAVVPIVGVTTREEMPGGAANTAVNAVTLGARARLITVIGNDEEGKHLMDLCHHFSIDTALVQVVNKRQTLSKRRVLGNGQMLLRLDAGTEEVLSRKEEMKLVEAIESTWDWAEAVIISDYDYGLITPAILRLLKRLSRNKVVMVDAKRLRRYRGLFMTAVKPNYGQALQLLKLAAVPNGSRVKQIRDHGEKILNITGAEIAAITLDRDGAVVFEKGKGSYRTYTEPTEGQYSIGAGDTYVAALTLALTAGASMPLAAEVAAGAAKIVISQEGTSCCHHEELLTQSILLNKQITNRAALASLMEVYRAQGKHVVFTNGCFDLLHRGHVTYLNQAKALGEVLIVALNSDESVKRLKGPQRPINTLEDRMQVVEALSSVDHVVSFEEDTPINLIKIVRPQVYVKGGDYDLSRLPEATWVTLFGGKVVILPYLADQSTTSMIKRIRTQDERREVVTL